MEYGVARVHIRTYTYMYTHGTHRLARKMMFFDMRPYEFGNLRNIVRDSSIVAYR